MEELLNLIKRRYIHERAIYTWCGIALVAVNPYQDQDIYGDQAVETYHSASHSVYLQLDPHIYAVTEDAYSKLERNFRDQSIIVSGESGAGKTVSAKHAMQYLASIASSKSSKLRIENRVLASNPIMEAIGNASTVRNDNSSRFGKYIQIFFDRHGRKIMGANMRTYLLEKSRVTMCQLGERNFHIFYQLLSYAQKNPTKQEIINLRLINSSDEQAENQQLFKFRYLGCDDSKLNRQLQAGDDLRKFNEALKTLNIDAQRTDIIYRIIAGILHGGNIDFCAKTSGSFDSDSDEDDLDAPCQIDPRSEFHFKAFCDLIGLDATETSERFTTRLLQSGRETITQPLNRKRAEYCRDAMLKYIYECLFNWLVSLINLSLKGPDVEHQQQAVGANANATAVGLGSTISDLASPVTHHLSIIPKSPSNKKAAQQFGIENKDSGKQSQAAINNEPFFIGVLDIYGFENFKCNSFEQFCINYANEVLQQQYNQHVFKLEQEEYIREGIDWTFIEYSDNQPVIDVIESKPIGILNLLDEECRMPKGTDMSWCAKLYDQLLPSAGKLKEMQLKLKQQQTTTSSSKKSMKFNNNGANHDATTDSSLSLLLKQMQTSQLEQRFRKPKIDYQKSFIINHYAEEVTYDVNSFLEKNRDTIAEEQGILLSKSEVLSFMFEDPSLPQSIRPVQRNNRSATVGCQFRASLTALIKTLNDTEPHYIRCIKPNDEKKAFSFNEERAIQQLKACGVYETIRISNNGFPSRWLYKDFAKRYCVLIYGTSLFESIAHQSLIIQEESIEEACEDNSNDGGDDTVSSSTKNNKRFSLPLTRTKSEESFELKPVNQKDCAPKKISPQALSRFMRQFSASDIRPICDAICKICYEDSCYEHLRTEQEQSYLDELYERHGKQLSAIYQFGKSKIFFRAGQVGYLERIRSQKLRNYTITIQRHVRGWLARVAFAKQRELYLEQMRREASLVSLQNQVNSLQTELEQVKDERTVEECVSISRIESIYHFAINIMYSTIQPLIIAAILEYEALDDPDPFASLESRSTTPTYQPMQLLLRELNRFHEFMMQNHVAQDICLQAFKQLFYLICAQSLNQLLIRRDLCQFPKAMQISYNLSCLIQWCREKFIIQWRELVEQLDPITQATKLLQTRKSIEDIATIEEVCNKLRPSQIIKLLNMYTSTYEEQITTDFIHELEEYLHKTRATGGSIEDDYEDLDVSLMLDGNNNAEEQDDNDDDNNDNQVTQTAFTGLTTAIPTTNANNDLLMDTKVLFKFIDNV